MIPISKENLWSSNNQARTHALFAESCKDFETPAMTLEKDDPNLPCLKNYYIDLVVKDPSECEFAETVFNDIAYWLALRETKFFQKYLEKWQTIVEIKRKKIAFSAIVKEVEEGGRSSFTAAKFLIDEPWKPKDKATRDKKRETTTQAFSVFNDDVDRLRENGLLQ